MSARTGAPPLDLGRRRDVRSGSWHQLCQCCKDAEYLCQRSKIIQIECTEIRTLNVVQDSIKIMYDTFLLWLHKTINHTYNVNVPKNKPQKNTYTNMSKYWRFCPLQSGIGGTTVPISECLQTFRGRNCQGKIFLQFKYLSNVDINYITVITVKRPIIPLILITSHRSIGLTFAVSEKRFVSPFFTLILKKLDTKRLL